MTFSGSTDQNEQLTPHFYIGARPRWQRARVPRRWTLCVYSRSVTSLPRLSYC